MGKINKPVVNGVANRFYYRGSEYDIRQTKKGLQLYKDNRFSKNLLVSDSEDISIDDIINDVENLKNGETIYQLYEYVGTSTTGQITIPTESAIFDLYGDGVLDAIMVKSNLSNRPTNINSTNASGEIVQVLSLDNAGNYTIDSAPVDNSCMLYYVKISDEFKSNIPQDSIISPGIPLAQSPYGVITVAKSNGDFTTIEAALDSITDNSSANRYVIQVAPGIYTENNPLQGKEYVNLKAVGDLQTTRIVAANPNADLMVMSNLFTLQGFSLWDVTGANNYAINQSVEGITSLTRCLFGNCSNGALINNSLASMTINDCGVFNPIATTIRGVSCQAGALNINTLIGSLGNVITLLEATGVDSSITANNVRSILPSVVTAISVRDLAKADINGANFSYIGTAVEIEGGAHAHLNGVRVDKAATDGVRINDIGANTILNVQSTIVENSVGFDFNLLSSTCLVSGNASTSINKINFVSGARMYGTVLDLQEDDEGVNIIGELHVGLPEKGTESVFGEGDSYTRGMLVYSETELGAFTDRSIAAGSASGSTFTYDGVVTDNAIYVASSLNSINGPGVLPHYGIKSKLDTAIVGGIVVAEYWNGTIWAELNGMEVDSDGKYYPHAKNYFQNIGGHHIRYDSVLVNDSWSKNDPMGLGTDYFWTRFRIASTITVAPVFEQFKLHTNRFEINADGWTEYFAKARPIGQLSLSLASGVPFEGAMQSQDLYVSQDIGVGGSNNKFTATGDKLGVNGFLPFDCDTSSPLNLTWSGHPSATGNYEWTVRWAWITEGDPVTYAEPGAPIANSSSIVITKAVTVDTVVSFEASLDISDMISRRDGGFGDELWISIQPTILSGNFTLGSSQTTYTKWCEGGHI